MTYSVRAGSFFSAVYVIGALCIGFATKGMLYSKANQNVLYVIMVLF